MNATLTPIILDSSALVALANSLDADHERALVISKGLQQDRRRDLFLPDAVFVETLNVLGRKTGHANALQTAEVLLSGDPYVVVESCADITQAALARWSTQAASTSFTD